MMVERIPTSEHIAHMIETDQWALDSYDAYYNEYTFHSMEVKGNDIDPLTNKPYYESPEYISVRIKHCKIFRSKVWAYRENSYLPFTKAEKRRIVSAFKTWYKIAEVRWAESTRIYKERQQKLLWYP